MSDFFSKLQPIIDASQNLQKDHLTVYIHCSKLNSLLQSIKLIPEKIESEKNNPSSGSEKKSPKRSINFKNRNAVSNIQNVIEQVQSMANQCLKETCVHYLLNNPIKTARKEIQSFRETLHNNFELLKLNSLAAEFKIPKEELLQQDHVDMKRISQILTQLTLKNRTDVADKIAQRFKSLKKIGIESELGEKQVLTIPDLQLPTTENLLLNHEDVRLGKEIGRGQSGSVHIGYIHRPNSDSNSTNANNDEIEVAVKVLFRRALTTPELESFRREIYTLSILVHPNLLKFYGYTENPPFYIVTDYMPNGSVFTALRNSPEKLTPTKRSLIAYDVAKGIEFLHQRNIIHRDLKSLNVLLDSDFRAKICDFGMARLNSNDPKTGLIGTVHWMAPEVLMSSPTYDSKVDVYSFGIFMWELLTGDMPYKDQKPHEIIAFVTDGGRPPLPDDIPPKLRELITKCWSKTTTERPTMSKVVSILGERDAHFPGTDEAAFQIATGIVNNHRSTKSMNVEGLKKRQLYGAKSPADNSGRRGRMIPPIPRGNKNDDLDDGLGIDLDDLAAAEQESLAQAAAAEKKKKKEQEQQELFKNDSFAFSNENSNTKSSGESSISVANDESSEIDTHKTIVSNELKIMDTAQLVNVLHREKDRETQNNALEILFKKISLSKRESDIAVKAGLCNILSHILDQKSQSSDNVLRVLAKFSSSGDYNQIFDITVLKSLLRYSELDEDSAEEMRSRALSVLISASSKQVDFLKESPLFITQLLSFIVKPPSNQQLCKSLLQLIRKLLSATNIFPGVTVMQLLFSAKLSLLEPLRPIVIDCITILVSRFKDGKEQMTREMMIECIKDINSCQPILDGYASDIIDNTDNDNSSTAEDSTDDEQQTKSSKKKKNKKKKKKNKQTQVVKYSNDGLLVSLLFTAKANETVFSFLVKIAEKKRFAQKIAKQLPSGLNTEVVASLYRPLLNNKKCLQILSNISEFYSVLSYLIAHHEYNLTFQVLRSVDQIPEDLVNHSPLCRLITEAFNAAGTNALSLSPTSSENTLSESTDNNESSSSKSHKTSGSKLSHKSKSKKSKKDKKDKNKSKESFEIEDEDDLNTSLTSNQSASTFATQNEDDETDEIMLMGCVYNLSKDDAYYYEFKGLFPKIWNILINGPPSLKLPSFLAVTSLACFNLDGIDVKVLFNICSVYVSYNSSITREVAFKFINLHLSDDKIDLYEAVNFFIKNHVTFNDDIEKNSVKLFLNAATSSSDKRMSLFKDRLEEIYDSLLHHNE